MQVEADVESFVKEGRDEDVMIEENLRAYL